MDEIDDFGKISKVEAYKFLAFQLGQTNALFKNQELYSKKDVSEKYPSLKKYLYREENVDTEDLQCVLDTFYCCCLLTEMEEKDDLVFFPGYNKLIDVKSEKYIETQN